MTGHDRLRTLPHALMNHHYCLIEGSFSAFVERVTDALIRRPSTGELDAARKGRPTLSSPPVVAYKFVAADYVSNVLTGRFKIGSLQYYREMEPPQGDPLDGAASSNMYDLDPCTIVDPEGNTINITGRVGRFEYVSAHQGYALCFCANARSKAFPDKPAVIRVADMELLSALITDANPQLPKPRFGGRVSYSPVEYSIQESGFQTGDPYRKAVRFEEEDELRLYWPVDRAQGWFLGRPFEVPPGLLERL